MITAVIITKNEETNIVDCLESLKFCDEKIVIDDNSHDRTRSIARSMGAKVYIRALARSFSAQRNFGIEKAQGDWILFIDADERITDELASEIQNVVQQNKHHGYYLSRQDYMWGKALIHGETSHVTLVRLAKKNAGKWHGRVHEVWEIKGKTGKLKNVLVHNPHPKLSDFLEEINFYSTLRAEELYSQGVKTSLITLIAYPNLKFFQNCILRRGFQDGLEGFVFACMMSLHSFLVRSKLYLLNHHGKAS